MALARGGPRRCTQADQPAARCSRSRRSSPPCRDPEDDSRVLPLAHVPRAIVNRDTRGLIKIVTDADTGRIIGITALAQDAGDLAAAGVYILEAGMTTDQVANLWSPYLTMAEGLKLTAQTFTTDITKLSCCAA